MKKRICVIGLDGVGLQNLRNILRQSPFNELTKIVNNGFTSPFTSIPPYTPCAWTSIFTSVNPGKHGVFGFHNVSRLNGGFCITLASSSDVMYPRVFEISAISGFKSVVVNVPLTYPVQGLIGANNLVVVSDWASPRQFIHPRRLEERYGEYLIEPPHRWSETTDAWSYAERVEEFLKTRLNIYYDLLEEFDYDLFVVVFSELDWLMHRIPGIIKGKDLNFVSGVLSLIDRFIRRATEVCDLIVLMSDHGFQVVKIFLGVNSMLADEGMLSYSYKIDFSKILSRIGLRVSGDSYEGSVVGGEPIKGFTSEALTRVLSIMEKLVPSMLLGKLENIAPLRMAIDYSSSKAFMIEGGTWGVYVRRGYEDTVWKVFGWNKLIEKIVRSRSLFHGPYMDRAPDLILVPKPGVWFDPRVYAQPVNVRIIGEHEPHALLAIFGDEVLSNRDVEDLGIEVSIYDIAPTLLAYMGLPPAWNSDGRPLTELFTVKLPAANRRTDYLSRFRLARKARRAISSRGLSQ